ncbi:MAG: glycerophosphodiester phosphodiesterase, partial [Candidatus Hinthialibacter sp.]
VELNPQPAYVEIDLHRSLDGVLVVSHDANTQRTCGVNSWIRETPFSLLRTYDAGLSDKFGTQFQNEPLPRLEEVLDVVKNTPVGIMIECKQLLLEDQIIDLLRKRHELHKHIIASFDDLTVYRAKQLEPAVRTLYLTSGINPDFIGRTRDLRADIIGFNMGEKPSSVPSAQQAGFQAWVWTVDKPEDIQIWIEAGVNGIITNQPELALTILANPQEAQNN